MSLLLNPFAPIEIPHQKTGKQKYISEQHIKDFWDQAASEMSEKQGCYIFALKAAQGFTPWYVGKATKNFKQEALSLHKIQKYNDILSTGRTGTPVMFFVALPENKNKVPQAIINEMEQYLIKVAFKKNPEIKNKRHIKPSSWGIKGVLRGGQGRATKEEKAFKTMMGI